jgi:hypothetical protein
MHLKVHAGSISPIHVGTRGGVVDDDFLLDTETLPMQVSPFLREMYYFACGGYMMTIEAHPRGLRDLIFVETCCSTCSSSSRRLFFHVSFLQVVVVIVLFFFLSKWIGTTRTSDHGNDERCAKQKNAWISSDEY